MVARAWDGEAAERPVRLQIGRALAGVLTFSGVLPGWLSRASQRCKSALSLCSLLGLLPSQSGARLVSTSMRRATAASRPDNATSERAVAM